MTYRCMAYACGKTAETGEKQEGEWRSRTRRCTCGAVMFPLPLIEEVGQGVIMLLSAPGRTCPNASRCAKHGLYEGDCEDGVIKPKCLYFLLREIEGQIRRMSNLLRSQSPPNTP